MERTLKKKLFKESMELIYSGHCSKAHCAFEELIEKFPDTPDFYFGRGFAAYQMRDLDSALMDLSWTIYLRADYFEAYYWRALVYLDKGQDDLCFKDLVGAAELADNNPGNSLVPLLLKGLAITLFDNGYFESAIMLINGLIKGSGFDDAEAFYIRSRLQVRLGNIDTAIRDLESASSIDPIHRKYPKRVRQLRARVRDKKVIRLRTIYR